MTVRFQNSYFSAATSSAHVQGALSCDNCYRLSVADRVQDQSSDIESFAYLTGISWEPRTPVSKDFPDVPAHIASAAKEAHEAHSINARVAAILMARTVVEATAKDRGIKTGRLVAKIDAMQAADLIRKSTAEAAHEIRHFGNDMAHGDLEEVPDSEDAAEVLTLMDEILNEVYQGPARTARVKGKRTATDVAEVEESTDDGTTLVI